MLSDLETATLGVVSLNQPCSGYAIRKVFERSLSSHWRGSTGAIYPLLRRLETRKLIKSTRRSGDGRSARSYQLTAKGKSDLAKRLRPPLPDPSGLVTMDPLRVRIRFMGVLPREDQRAVVHEAREKLKCHIALVSTKAREDKQAGDTYRYLAHRSAIVGMRAQLAWLNEVEALI